MRRFNKMVLSNSTFAWWAGFLSAAERIYLPITTNGSGYAFRGFGDVDLLTGEPRYTAVNVTVFNGMSAAGHFVR
jgi:hypothetical protein